MKCLYLQKIFITQYLIKMENKEKKFVDGLYIFKTKFEGLLNWSAKKNTYIEFLKNLPEDENGFISGSYSTSRNKPDRMFATVREKVLSKEVSAKDQNPERDLPF